MMRSFTSTISVLLLALAMRVDAAPAISRPRDLAQRDGSGASLSMSSEQVSLVRANMLSISNQSWEIGTAAEALTEWEWSSLSVFGGSGSFPPPSTLGVDNNASDVLAIAEKLIAIDIGLLNKKNPNTLPLINGDGAVGDPASIGNAVLLANWTRANLSDTRFATAASQQLEYLLTKAPRSSKGAISQRESEVQLWADFVYMAPPFIAYYGALQSGVNQSALLQIAYDQCRLYRDALFDGDKSLWRHIVYGSSEDANHWGTGNGWAAAGMLRVLETIGKSAATHTFDDQKTNLTIWINEILDGTWSYQKENGTLYNYIDDDMSFADTASTALLGSVTYRMATLTGNLTHVKAADKALKLIDDSVDSEGWLQGTVDPLTFNSPSAAGNHSPEAASASFSLSFISSRSPSARERIGLACACKATDTTSPIPLALPTTTTTTPDAAMFVMLIATFVAALVVLSLRIPAVWLSFIANDEPSDAHELGMALVATTQPNQLPKTPAESPTTADPPLILPPSAPDSSTTSRLDTFPQKLWEAAPLTPSPPQAGSLDSRPYIISSLHHRPN
ncbi:hypothetical protein EW146_g6382 [Bondarzewia mesenterica]|uniref:Six-hairpin glycosidase n=1 Tax=Bondarzewia mesenterica TaxID=1095465 RepID=A0A4S4LNW0_9AGAM|nr:hypothetical protein EW146_g6382 [Bondarzewia mesenterica]